MKPNEECTEYFHGMVKYGGSSGSIGSVKWKMGSIAIDKTDEQGWKILMMFDCSDNPVLSCSLTHDTLKKAVCKDTILIDVKRSPTDRDLISLYLKSSDKRIARRIQELCAEVVKKQPAGLMSNSEVGITTPPAKSGLFTVVGNIPSGVKTDKENLPQSFTSVKTHKREPPNDEGKENLIKSCSKSNEQYLQRGVDKSRQCLSTLTSSFYGKSSAQPVFSSSPKLSISKRGPGLMPDPTPVKRARLSDSISYSMKTKPTPPTDSCQLQTLQGFSNLGNTCYMNAILQSLFGLETFSSDLLSNRRMAKALQQQSLYFALVRLLFVKRQINSSDVSRREALRRVKSAISTTAKRFSGYGQHDAHEFLGQVLDQLKEEVIKISKATPTPNKENEGGVKNVIEPASPYSGHNPITVNFEFEVLHTLTCLQCQEQVTKTEQFHDISLDVPKRKDLLTPRSLQDALSLFFKNELIEYTCEKCGHGKSDVSHKITRLPRYVVSNIPRLTKTLNQSYNDGMVNPEVVCHPSMAKTTVMHANSLPPFWVFILHLKRYTYNQVFSKHTKMGSNVSVPTFLTMLNHCTEETQPAFPPTVQDPSHSDTKAPASILTDTKQDTPSRRKLEYSGYNFKSKGESPDASNKPKDNETVFTETKEKKDEVDTVITLEDEDDQELSRAIEMSLKEQEEKNQMCRDYGDDSETNYERVLELSRQDHHSDVPKPKKVQDMSEDEMMQLAIAQSLMDTDANCRGNNSDTDDVFTNSDHMYTRNNDVIGRDDHFYTGNYDIGPDGDHFDNISTKSRKTYGRRRHCSDSDINKKSESKMDLFTSVNTTSTNTASMCTDVFRSNGADLSHSSVGSLDINERKTNGNNHDRDTHTDDVIRMCDDAIRNGDVMSETVNTPENGPGKHWRNRLHNLSSELSDNNDDSHLNHTADNIDCSDDKVANDLLCKEDMPDNCDSESELPGVKTKCPDIQKDFNSDNKTSGLKARCPGKVYELHDIDNLVDEEFEMTDGRSNGVYVDSCEIRTKSEMPSVEDNCMSIEGISGTKDSKPAGSGLQRRCQLTTKGDNEKTGVPRNVKVDEFVFEDGDDDDDSWLSLVDDKENKSPYSQKPKLSNPSEFSMDTTEIPSDEVDAFIEENMEIPIINNEKGDLPYSYRLVSIVNHMGISSVTGHYLSDVYDMKKRAWYSFDDSHVTKITEEDVKSKRERSGYIFFYMTKEIFDDNAVQHAITDTSKKT